MLLNLYTLTNINNEQELKEFMSKMKHLLQIGVKIYLTFLPRSLPTDFTATVELSDSNFDNVEEWLKQYYKHVNILVHVFV